MYVLFVTLALIFGVFQIINPDFFIKNVLVGGAPFLGDLILMAEETGIPVTRHFLLWLARSSMFDHYYADSERLLRRLPLCTSIVALLPADPTGTPIRADFLADFTAFVSAFLRRMPSAWKLREIALGALTPALVSVDDVLSGIAAVTEDDGSESEVINLYSLLQRKTVASAGDAARVLDTLGAVFARAEATPALFQSAMSVITATGVVVHATPAHIIATLARFRGVIVMDPVPVPPAEEAEVAGGAASINKDEAEVDGDAEKSHICGAKRPRE